ncbi:MAG: sigma-70 family RNA polymerase sigma factor [Pyrinomonadaceae bacterium]
MEIASEHSDEAAWSDLIERFGATVRSAARGASSNSETIEELTQSIWAELYGLRTRAEGAGGGGKLAHYSGRGSLGGWLRAVVGQLAIDKHRQTSRLVQIESEADGDRLDLERHNKSGGALGSSAAAAAAAAVTRNPETVLAAAQSAAALHEALSQDVGALEPEDRLLIKLYYFDDLRLREIGVLLGIHEATASRRLSHLQRELKKRVQKILVSERGWTAAEAERTLIETAAHLDVDLGHMFGAQVVSASEQDAGLIKSNRMSESGGSVKR